MIHNMSKQVTSIFLKCFVNNKLNSITLNVPMNNSQRYWGLYPTMHYGRLRDLKCCISYVLQIWPQQVAFLRY